MGYRGSFYEKFLEAPPVRSPTESMPASSKMKPPLAKAIRDSGSASGIRVKKQEIKICATSTRQRYKNSSISHCPWSEVIGNKLSKFSYFSAVLPITVTGQ